MDDFFDQSENSMPRIGDQAPAFRSVTTQGTIYCDFGIGLLVSTFLFVAYLIINQNFHHKIQA